MATVHVYATHEDGSPALWYDEQAGTLNDELTSLAVDDRADADECAAAWFDVMREGCDYTNVL